METKNSWKTITGTACVFGVAITAMSFNASQTLAPISYDLSKGSDAYIADYSYNQTERAHNEMEDNYVVQERSNSLMAEAESLFGKMRDATLNEQKLVNDYIKSISFKTGVNFFDLC